MCLSDLLLLMLLCTPCQYTQLLCLIFSVQFKWIVNFFLWRLTKHTNYFITAPSRTLYLKVSLTTSLWCPLLGGVMGIVCASYTPTLCLNTIYRVWWYDMVWYWLLDKGTKIRILHSRDITLTRHSNYCP